MSNQILTEAANLLHEAAVKLSGIGHAAGDKVHALVAELRGQETALQHEAVADGEQLAHDAEHAAAPVVAEAEADAAKLEGEAATAVAKDVTPPAAS